MSLAELARRILFFFRREQHTGELAEEMRLHMELRARQEEKAGFSPAEAQLRARRQFGNAPWHVEESRSQLGTRWADDLVRDLKYGLRSVRRAPMLSVIVVLTLGVGIGATTAMFSVMDAALFRPLPVRDAERLVILPWVEVPLQGMQGMPVSPRPDPLELTSLHEQTHMFETVGAFAVGGLNLTGGVEPVRVDAALITPSAMRMPGIAPLLGRIFTNDEGEIDGADVVVISHSLWRQQFGADPGILGKRVSLNDRGYEVVGVMPPRYAFPEGSQIWMPLTVPLVGTRTEIFRMLIMTSGIARLAPGMTVTQANADLAAAREASGRRLAAGASPPVYLVPLREHYMGESDSRLRLVMALAALLMAAACANVCGLLLARWSGRRRELAVRAAIGASRRRLLRQLVTESALLALLGALAGLAFAVVGMRLFEALTPPELLALTPPQLDARVLTLALGLAVLAALGAGVLPALASSRGDLTRSLKSGGVAGATRRGGRWLGGSLVVVEVAVAVVLLVGSGLLLKSLVRLLSIETGIRAEQVVTARVALSRTTYPRLAERRAFYSRVEEELAQAPGITSAAIVGALPLRGEINPRLAYTVGHASPDAKPEFAELMSVTPEYFAALGIPILAGRTFEANDTAAVSRGVIVNESLARRHWSTTAVGETLSRGSTPYTVVGVVGDVQSTTLVGERYDQMYFPFSRSSDAHATLVARASIPPAAALDRLRDGVRRVDSSQVVFEMKTMENVVHESVAAQRASSTLAATFGAITLLLAAMGLYGLLAFGVVQRTHELGIRFALGAQRHRVVGGVIRDAVLLTVVGALLGTLAAYWATRLLRSELFEVTPTDITVFVAAPLVLIVTALLAAWIPARRAAQVNPLIALRME